MVMVDGSRRVTLRNRKYLRKYTPFQCKPFAAKPVLVNGTPVGTPVEDVLKNQKAPQLQPQPRSDPGSEETAVDQQNVQVQQAAGDGHAPHPAKPGGQVAEHQVGGGHAPSPVTNVQVVATPVGVGQVAHQPHTAGSQYNTGTGSPRRDQVPRSRSPGMDRRESVEPAPDGLASGNREPEVRRSSRANKGKLPKSLADFEVEL